MSYERWLNMLKRYVMFNRHVTPNLVEQYLTKHGWPQHIKADRVVLTGWKSDHGSHQLFIHPYPERKLLEFVAPLFDARKTAGGSDSNMNALFLGMAIINWRITAGNFGYNPGDGMVGFSLYRFTDDDDLSFEEFDHMLNALIFNVETLGPTLVSLAGGKVPLEDLQKLLGTTPSAHTTSSIKVPEP